MLFITSKTLLSSVSVRYTENTQLILRKMERKVRVMKLFAKTSVIVFVVTVAVLVIGLLGLAVGSIWGVAGTLCICFCAIGFLCGWVFLS